MRKNIISIAIIAIIFVLSSCEKDEVALSQPQANATKDILTFATQEDFDKTLAKVNAMTKEERIAWEKKQGFKSFGSKSDSIYENTNPDNFKSKVEMEEFLKKYSNYFEVNTNVNGVMYVDLIEHSNDLRYLMNEDKMLIVGDKAFKSMKNELLSDKLVNFDKVKQADGTTNSNSSMSKVVSSSFVDNIDIWGPVKTVSGQKYTSKVCFETDNELEFWTGLPQRKDRLTFYNYKWTLWTYWGDYSTYTTMSGNTTTANCSGIPEIFNAEYYHAGTNAYESKYAYFAIGTYPTISSYYMHYDFDFSNAKGVNFTGSYNY